MADMARYLVPVTFPDLDTATRDAGSLLDALRTAGLTAELVDAPPDTGDASGRPDPGTTTVELHVHADAPDEALRRVQEVTDGQFPPGMVLLGEPTPI